MNLSVINIILIIGLGLLLGQVNNKIHRNLYIMFMMLIFLLEASLRHPSVGMDTNNYIMFFEYVQEKSWSELWDEFFNRYFGYNETEEDLGYTLFAKLLSSITSDWNLFEFLRDTVFFIPFGIYLKKYADNFYHLLFAMVFYVALLHSIPMNGGRQLLALGFGILSFLALQEKKYWKSVVWILLGALFHQSCLLCFLILGCSLFAPQALKRVHVVSLILFPMIWMNVNRIIVFMGESIGSEKFAHYGMGLAHGQTVTFILLLELLSFFCLFAIKNQQLHENHSLKVFYSTIIGTTLFGPLIWANGAMIRTTMYFFVYMTLLVPYAIDSMFIKKDRNTVYILVITILGGLYLSGSKANYYFFWQ